MSEMRAALQALVEMMETTRDAIDLEGSAPAECFVCRYRKEVCPYHSSKALLARPEPEPRITREEAMRLLDEFNVASSKAFSNHNHEYFLQRYKQATEACLAAMLK